MSFDAETQLRRVRIHKMPPRVYPLAAFLGHRFDCSYVFDVGCQAVEELALLHPLFKVGGLCPEHLLGEYRRRYPFGSWWPLGEAGGGARSVPREVAGRAAVVCGVGGADPVARAGFKGMMEAAPVGMLCEPAAARGEGGDECDEVSACDDFERRLRAEGYGVRFVGMTSGGERGAKCVMTAVVGNGRGGEADEDGDVRVPDDFRVVAVMTVYNEEDIIVPALRRLIAQGIEVYVVDNWSTDASHRLAQQFLGNGVIGLERFPAAGPQPYFNLSQLLGRVEELTRRLEADWFVHHDADEIRLPPWPGQNLREGLYRVDRAGFNCVDHTVLMFQPVNDGYVPGSSFEDYFRYCEFGRQSYDFIKLNAWKNTGSHVTLAEHGGHEVRFEGRRIYPFKFLLKHYQVRSQEHGLRKVLRERKARWNPAERARGWHGHYDHIGEDFNFLGDPDRLILFDEDRFNRLYLAERLAGVGAAR